MIAETVLDVRYPDCDRMGIVHHGVYPIWYEAARMDFFQKMGFSYSDMNALGINPPLVALDLRYQSPTTYPGQVVISTHIQSYAPKKLELVYECRYEGKVCSTARSFHIWTGPDGKSLNMEENLPEVYAKIQAAYEEVTP
jgi:acyl-CoA thioester hydrolase